MPNTVEQKPITVDKMPNTVDQMTKKATKKPMELKIFRTRREILESDDKFSAGARRTRPLANIVNATRAPNGQPKSKSLDEEPSTRTYGLLIARKRSAIPTASKISSSPRVLASVAPARDNARKSAAAALAESRAKTRLPKSATLGATPRPARKFVGAETKSANSSGSKCKMEGLPEIIGLKKLLTKSPDLKGSLDESIVFIDDCDYDNDELLLSLNANNKSRDGIAIQQGNGTEKYPSNSLSNESDPVEYWQENKTVTNNKNKPIIDTVVVMKLVNEKKSDECIVTEKEDIFGKREISPACTPTQTMARNAREESRGTDSHAHVAQTVHIKRKECAANETVNIVVRWRRYSTQDGGSMPSVYEESAASQFVFMLPASAARHMPSQRASAVLTVASSLRSANVNSVSQSTTQLDRAVVTTFPANFKSSRDTPISASQPSGIDAPPQRATSDLSLARELNFKVETGTVTTLPKFPLNAGGNTSPNDRNQVEYGTRAVTVGVSKSTAKQMNTVNGGAWHGQNSCLRKKTSLPAESTTAPSSQAAQSSTAAKLADKLSRSFFDLTQGSHDRLVRWKTKLQQQYGGGGCGGDGARAGGPNGTNSKSNHSSGLKKESKNSPKSKKSLRAVESLTSEMEILVDWTSGNQQENRRLNSKPDSATQHGQTKSSSKLTSSSLNSDEKNRMNSDKNSYNADGHEAASNGHEEVASTLSPYSSASGSSGTCSSTTGSSSAASCRAHSSGDNWKRADKRNDAKIVDTAATIARRNSLFNSNGNVYYYDSNNASGGGETPPRAVYPYRYNGSLARPHSSYQRSSYDIISAQSAPPPPPPRPLRASYSATNAFNYPNAIVATQFDGGKSNKCNESTLHSLKFKSSSSSSSSSMSQQKRRSTLRTNEPSSQYISNNNNYDKNNNNNNKNSIYNNKISNIYKSNSLREEDGSNYSSGIPWDRNTSLVEMEHRTLRQRHSNFNNINTVIDNNNNNNNINKFGILDSKYQIDYRNGGECAKALSENQLPPPARILPYSGIKPQDNAIIRPIAFRPMGSSANNAKAAHRQSIGLELASAYYKDCASEEFVRPFPHASFGGGAQSAAAYAYEQHRQILRDQSRSIGNLACSSMASTRPFNNGSINQQPTASAGYFGSSTHLFDGAPSRYVSSSLAHQHRSVESPHVASPVAPRAHHLTRHASVAGAERDYDTVAELGRPRIIQDIQESSSRSSQQQKSHSNPSKNNNKDNNSIVSAMNENKSHNNGYNAKGLVQKTALIFQQNSEEKTQKTHFSAASNGYGSASNGYSSGANTSAACTSSRSVASASTASMSSASSSAVDAHPAKAKSGQSSDAKLGADRQTAGGLHITPSPSDSGIVDYESLIRDKEHELSSVRHAMEQNEEVLIRVYAEKERAFGVQIADLQRRCDVSVEALNALREQLTQSERIRQQLQSSVRMLTDDCNNHQLKCRQMEGEIEALRSRCKDLETRIEVREDSNEKKANRNGTPANTNLGSVYENVAASIVLVERRTNSDQQQQQHPPVPAPRSMKDSTISLGTFESNDHCDPDQKEHRDLELRGEVDQLRGEISSLRDQLNTQFRYFAEERRRWESSNNITKDQLPTNRPKAYCNGASIAALKSNTTVSGKATEFSAAPTVTASEKHDTVAISKDRLV